MGCQPEVYGEVGVVQSMVMADIVAQVYNGPVMEEWVDSKDMCMEMHSLEYLN